MPKAEVTPTSTEPLDANVSHFVNQRVVVSQTVSFIQTL